MPSHQRGLVPHRAGGVAGGVFEPDEGADPGDRGLGHEDAPSGLLDPPGHIVDVVHGERALEPHRLRAVDQLPAVLERGQDAARAGLDLVEVRRTPGLEGPAQDGLVEAASAFDIVGVDGEVGEVGGHGVTIAPHRSGVLPTLRQKMSLMRHATDGAPAVPDLAVRGYSVTHPSGTVILPTAPGWDHLVFASSGVMTVGTPDGEWVVPPHRALWAPSGVPFRIQFHGRVGRAHALPPHRAASAAGRPAGGQRRRPSPAS